MGRKFFGQVLRDIEEESFVFVGDPIIKNKQTDMLDPAVPMCKVFELRPHGYFIFVYGNSSCDVRRNQVLDGTPPVNEERLVCVEEAQQFIRTLITKGELDNG